MDISEAIDRLDAATDALDCVMALLAGYGEQRITLLEAPRLHPLLDLIGREFQQARQALEEPA